MRLVAESGLWTTGPRVPPPPGVAVLEVDGAVFEWTVDDPVAPPRVTFTDLGAADWLWRLVGHSAHVTLLGVAEEAEPRDGSVLDVDAEVIGDSMAPLRRLALGHWLRRWWPASARDGIVTLDPAVLDAELAILTTELQDYLAEDAYDVELTTLLTPHRTAFSGLTFGDPRVADLVRSCEELAHELGLPAPSLPADVAAGARSDYALAAGAGLAGTGREPIAHGVGNVNWVAVPPGCFDAAEATVDWSVEAAGRAAVAEVRVAASASVAGIEVRLRSGHLGALGLLDADGRATLPLVDLDDRPVVEDVAWNHDWPQTTVTIGADVADSAEAAELRRRLRDFARTRLAAPGPDAYLAEILAAEGDY